MDANFMDHTLSNKGQFQSLPVTNEEIKGWRSKGDLFKATKLCNRKIKTRCKVSKILTQSPFHYIAYTSNPKHIPPSFFSH